MYRFVVDGGVGTSGAKHGIKSYAENLINVLCRQHSGGIVVKVHLGVRSSVNQRIMILPFSKLAVHTHLFIQ